MKRMKYPYSKCHNLLNVLTIILVVLCCFTACIDEGDRLYTNIRAFFWYTRVITTPPLHRALGNPGQFCKITFEKNGRYVFASPNGESYVYTPTALDQYGKPEFVAGFIVGTSGIPDLTGNFYSVAFDLVCPNCYRDNAIPRKCNFDSKNHTIVKCSLCSRSYNLDNGGIVVAGKSGRPLYRYRMSYAPATGVLFIQN